MTTTQLTMTPGALATGAPTCIIYCRMSLDRTGAGLGIQRQEDECRALAARLGLVVVAVYTDNDMSASKKVRRPGYEDALQLLGQGGADALVVWHLDRLLRTMVELERVISIIGKRPIHTVSAGLLDLSNPAGQLQARVVGSVAQYEGAQKAERQRAKNRQLASGGYWRGGPAPFGYQLARLADVDASTLVPDPAEAEHYQWMVQQVLAGRSLYSMQQELNGRGVLTSTGHQWSRQSLRRLLTTPTHAGRISIKRADGGPAGWPALVSMTDWQVMQTILGDERRKVRKPSATYLLTGLVENHLGRKMLGATRQTRSGDRARIYGNGGGNFVKGEQGAYIRADHLEAFIVAAVLAESDERVLAPASAADHANARVLATLDQLDAEEAELIALRKAGKVSLAVVAELSTDIEQRRDEATRGLQVSTTVDRELQPYLITTGRLREVWPAFTHDQQRQVLRRLIRRVVVQPIKAGNHFHPERVTIHWVVSPQR